MLHLPCLPTFHPLIIQRVGISSVFQYKTSYTSFIFFLVTYEDFYQVKNVTGGGFHINDTHILINV